MPGDLTSALAAVVCGAFVTTAEPVLIPLLRRAPVVPLRLVLRSASRRQNETR